jgi:hypothetical protein
MIDPGTELWNATSMLRKKANGQDLEQPMGQRGVPMFWLTIVRYMTCLMLEAAASPGNKQAQCRSFQTYLKATKFCIGSTTSPSNTEINSLNLAQKSIETAAKVSL